MHRREFIGALTGAALAGCSPAERKPNVLFIAIDDMNDYVNCLGGRAGVQTPHIDRLAARGVLFTNAHCASPACHPSRTALMTGVSPATSGISRNHFREARASWRRSPALADAVTLSQHFRNHGYEATGGGKIYHALQWTEGAENEPESWDSYFPDALDTIPEWLLPQGFDPEKNRAEGRHPWFHWEPLPVSDEQTSDYQVVDWAIGELERPRDRPFFLGCGIFRPHMPWHVPQKYFDLYPLDTLELPFVQEGDLDDTHGHDRRHWHKWVLDHEQWPQAVQSYLASISYTDAQVGRLLAALDESPHADDTVIVLWSDHGMHIGEKENWEKFTLWEESTRVPLIFAGPGVAAAGESCSQAASLLDVYPTLAELCALPEPPNDQLEGLSLVPQLQDPTVRRERPAVTTFRGDNHAVRTERWRYIRYSNGDEELYDHDGDPHEFTNLAKQAKHAETMAELRKWLPQTIAPSPYEEGFGEF